MTIPLRFTVEDADRAHDVWGSNCGPGAIAAICGLTLDELRPHLGDFESKGYTNPSLCKFVLARLRAKVRPTPNLQWPNWGLCRVQWEGPWTEPRVPPKAAYRHTHWVGSCQHDGRTWVFDINCIATGGWVPLATWVDAVVPWIMREAEGMKRAYGTWHVTHALEVEPASGVAEAAE